MRKDGRGKPYFFVIQIDGQRHQTPDCATAEEAANAGRMLKNIISKSRMFPPCTCMVPPAHHPMTKETDQ
jgi:hypothetical protein